jgi:hypothetical protein
MGYSKRLFEQGTNSLRAALAGVNSPNVPPGAAAGTFFQAAAKCVANPPGCYMIETQEVDHRAAPRGGSILETRKLQRFLVDRR